MSEFNYQEWLKQKEEEDSQLSKSRDKEAYSTTTTTTMPPMPSYQEEAIIDEEKFFNFTEEHEFGELEAIGGTSTYQPTVSDKVPEIEEFEEPDSATKSGELSTNEVGGVGAILLFLWTSGFIPLLVYICVGCLAVLLLIYWLVMVPNLSVTQRLVMVRSVLVSGFVCLLYPIRNTRVGLLMINYFKNAEAQDEPDEVMVEAPQPSPGRRLHPKSLKPKMYPTLSTISEIADDTKSESGSQAIDNAASSDGEVKEEKAADEFDQILDNIKVEVDDKTDPELDEQAEDADLWCRYRSLVDYQDSDSDQSDEFMADNLLFKIEELTDWDQPMLTASFQNWDTSLQVGKVSHTFLKLSYFLC
jgi:hypothetical protein